MRRLAISKVVFGQLEILQASAQTAASIVQLRPVLVLFSIAFIVLAFAAISNRKIEKLLLALPYNRLYQTIKSDKMIIFYATVAEVVLEVITAIILAGVSILITTWLLLEEAADRKQQKTGLNVEGCPGHDLVLKADPGPGSQHSVHSRFSQHNYISPTQSRIHRR